MSFNAAPADIAGIVAPLPVVTRAHLAAFCFSRVHLRAIGRQIAAKCDAASLAAYGGPALVRSLQRSSADGSTETYHLRGYNRPAPKVTLAGAAGER